MESLQDVFADDGRTLKLVTFFEDEAAGRRADRTVARIIEGIDPDTFVQQQRLSFDHIEESRESLDGWLGDADVIIVAGARTRSVPAVVVKAIERGLSPAVLHPTALIALLQTLSSRFGTRFFSTTAMATELTSLP